MLQYFWIISYILKLSQYPIVTTSNYAVILCRASFLNKGCMNFVLEARQGPARCKKTRNKHSEGLMVGSMPSPVLLGEERVVLVLLPNLPKLAPDREHVPLGGEEEPLSLGGNST